MRRATQASRFSRRSTCRRARPGGPPVTERLERRTLLSVTVDRTIAAAAFESGDRSWGGGGANYPPVTNDLGVSPVGGEFRVNTQPAGAQTSCASAADAFGNFIVAWQSITGDGSEYGIVAQRYNASGHPRGDEFLVNTVTLGSQQSPAVAMDADGDFVIAWQSHGDGEFNGIYAQRFNVAGEPQGGEFPVNTYTANDQVTPEVAMDDDGDFVVVWDSFGQDGSNFAVVARLYDANGEPMTDEFLVNTYTNGSQTDSFVDMAPDGSFVVVWTDWSQEGTGTGLNLGNYGQRFDASGARLGSEFHVNTYSAGAQIEPAVSVRRDGSFVVAWSGVTTRDTSGILARLYDAAGVPQTGEILVNEAIPPGQLAPSVGSADNGAFVVAWDAFAQDGLRSNVFARRFTAEAAPRGGEFRVNTYLPQDQRSAVVAVDADGDFVVAWNSKYQDGHGYGIYAQRYDAGLVPITVPRGAPDTTVDLRAAFSDPDDPESPLAFSVVGNTEPSLVSTAIDGAAGTLRLAYNAERSSGRAEITVRAANGSGLETETTFLVSVTPSGAVRVVDRHAFYNGSALDGDDPAANAADDAAIALTKEALLAGIPTAVNVSAFARGINGIMLDVADLPPNAEQALDVGDFTFRAGAGGDPSGWASTPAPDGLSIRRDAGVGGSDRVTVVWNDLNAVKNAWLQVTLKAGADTGLTSSDVFYFGSLVGDADGSREVAVGDVGLLATNFGLADRTPDQGDFTGDGLVTVADVGALATNFGRTLSVPSLAPIIAMTTANAASIARSDVPNAMKFAAPAAFPVSRIESGATNTVLSESRSERSTIANARGTSARAASVTRSARVRRTL